MGLPPEGSKPSGSPTVPRASLAQLAAWPDSRLRTTAGDSWLRQGRSRWKLSRTALSVAVAVLEDGPQRAERAASMRARRRSINRMQAHEDLILENRIAV